MSQSICEAIERTIKEHPVVLYMKGTADMPQCGFSAVIVQILHNVGVEFCDVNVLADPDVRQGIKDFSNWPTIPQLYVHEQFVGGSDIVREMYQNGELQQLFADKGLVEHKS